MNEFTKQVMVTKFNIDALHIGHAYYVEAKVENWPTAEDRRLYGILLKRTEDSILFATNKVCYDSDDGRLESFKPNEIIRLVELKVDEE